MTITHDIVMIITVLVTLRVAWLGMVHYFQLRKRELKEKAYINYVLDLQQVRLVTNASRVQSEQKIKEAERAYAASSAHLYLIGSVEVIEMLSQFDEISGCTEADNNKKQEIYALMVRSMRKDLKLTTWEKTKIRMYVS